MTATELIVASTIKGTLILVGGIAAAMALRRTSAAVRHGVWAATLAALLALPAALLLAPAWTVPIAASAPAVVVETVPAAVTIAARSPQPARWSWTGSLPGAWLLGALAAAGWFLIGALRISRIRSRCAAAPHLHCDAPVLEGAEVPVPAVCGLWRPVILLPLAAREWPAEQVRSALLHETMHIRRGDLWVQLLVQAVCSLYWFHPLAWLAARALRKEREGACDDAVLCAGVPAPEYAGHLIDLARALAGKRLYAPAMAERSDLEWRVRALLERHRDRRPLSSRTAAGMACVSLAVLLPIAAVHADARRAPRAQASPAVAPPPASPLPAPPPTKAPSAPPSRPRLVAQGRAPNPPAPTPDTFVNTQVPAINGPISGVVMDPTGAVVPGCRVIARQLDGRVVFGLVTDATGRYKFDSLPPGRYLLQFEMPGFKPSLVMAKDDSPQYVWLTVGSIAESVVVGAPKPAVAGVAPTPGPQRLRVGGMVQPSRLISRADLVYPPELQQLGIDGTVMLRAIISKTGEPTNLQVINTGLDPRLARAAVDSVSQWRYQPTLLNGEPVETETTITVEFKLEP